MMAASCKWCAKGECWTHTPGGGKGKGKGFGGGMGMGMGMGKDPMAAMAGMGVMPGMGGMDMGGMDMSQMAGAMAAMGGGSSSPVDMQAMMGMVQHFMSMMGQQGGGGGKSDCKWCRKGECWDHQGYGGKKGGFGKGARSSPYMEPFAAVEPASDADIETFLASHSVEAHAVEKLKSLDKKLAKAVISKGTLTDARDQTAVLISRCVEMQNLRPGDWVCQGCVHVNWAKNAECKKCSSPKPEV